MIGVTRIGGPAPVRTGARRGGATGFHVPADAAGATGGVVPTGLPGLLAAQEAAQDAVQDRDARRHGAAALDLLGAMQMALLSGAAAPDPAQLALLARRAPTPADPRLAAVQRALLLRLAVEAARAAAASR